MFAYCRAEDGRYWIDLPGLATFRFDGHSDRVVAAPHPGIPLDEVPEAYWHSALPLVLQARGNEVLHASGVLMPRGAVVLCGASKTGKSTIAYGLYRRGHGLWADDAVALDISGSAISALPLPFDVRLRPASAALFGFGERAARLAGQTASNAREGRAPAPLAAVCVLDRSSGAAGRRRDSHRSEPPPAFSAVLSHAYCFTLQHQARKRLMLDRYLSLVARIPVFELRVPDGLEGLPDILDTIEQAFSFAWPR